MRYGALIVSLLLIAACSKQETADNTPAQSPPPAATEPTSKPPLAQPALAGTAWRVTALDGVKLGADSKTSLEFLEDGKVAGRGGCNRYGGSVEIAGDSIHFGAVMSTKMACEAIEQEGRYFKALEETRRYRADKDGLVLMDEKGVERVRLQADSSAAT